MSGMKKKIFPLLALLLGLSGCDSMFGPQKPITIAGARARKWTILLYMAADNELEGEALDDINEMESVFPRNPAYSILALVDRAEHYDATDGDWTDSRLYEIQRDSGGNNNKIVSLRLACPDLDVSSQAATELNMADPDTLSRFLAFAQREYRAEHYALVLWGHGTGWRSVAVTDAGATAGAAARLAAPDSAATRAVAIDDGSGAYMDLPSLKKGLSAFYADVLGFDTCFGATLETAYETAPFGLYLAGSPGLIPAAGWDYADILSRFNASDMSAESLVSAITASFAAQYSGEEEYGISQIFLPAVKPFARAFCALAQGWADSITDRAAQTAVFSLIMDEAAKESAPTYPADTFVDAAGLIPLLGDYFQSSSLGDEEKHALRDAADTAALALGAACVETRRGGAPALPAFPVFFAVRLSPSACEANHSSAYKKDAPGAGQSSFVKETAGWTPTQAVKGSFLDKLFYESFD